MYREQIIVTPKPDMLAALIAGAFIKAEMPIWIKPNGLTSLKISFPEDQLDKALKLFNGLKKSAKKITHENTSGRNGRLQS